MGLLLITHDLGVVAEIAERVAVMHDGRMVETGPVAEVFGAPGASLHPPADRCRPGPARPRRCGSERRDDGCSRSKDWRSTTRLPRGLLRRETGEVIRAVDGVSFDLDRARRWASSARPAAASPRWRARSWA